MLRGLSLTSTLRHSRVVDLDGGDKCAPSNSSSSGGGGGAPLRATLFASATVDPNILSAYKIYFAGKLVAIGPGRGEAPVRGGNGNFSHRVYATHNVTAQLAEALVSHHGGGSAMVLAVEGQAPGDDTSWDAWDPYVKQHKPLGAAAILLQLEITRADGTQCVVSTENSSGFWQSAAADAYYRPQANKATMYSSAITEHIDARMEPVGWLTNLDFKPSPVLPWKPAVAVGDRQDLALPLNVSELRPKMTRPVLVVAVPAKQMVELPPNPPSPPPPAAPGSKTSTCGVKASIRDTPKRRLLLSCPEAGQLIDEVKFASFGSPSGSCEAGNLQHNRSCQSPSAVGLIESLCLGRSECSIPDSAGFFSPTGPAPGSAGGCQGFPTPHRLAVSLGCGVHTRYAVDFKQEFEGGLILQTTQGTAGHRVKISLGELMGEAARHFEMATNQPTVADDVTQTWGADFVWTLREGEQTITQHNYVNFRYAELVFLDGPPPPGLSVRAWGAAYEWTEGESGFASSNPILDHVWRLCANTLRYGVMGTYTDSNTRERRPYESDGIIAAGNRLLLQRDRLWARHSASWLINFPTWPIEWQQQTSLLALQDYIATGSPDLAQAYAERLLNDTKIEYIDSTGTVGRDTGHDTSFGGHIVGWDPAPGTCDPKPNCTDDASVFHASDHETPCNAWAVHGLQTLADMAALYGDHRRAVRLSKIATRLRQNVLAKMWDVDKSKFCDGLCANKTSANGSIYTDYTTLFLGLVPGEARGTVSSSVAAHGLERIGAYGAFLYLGALSKYPSIGDNGTAILHALTKCDATSWCAEWEQYNATLTMEAFPVDVVGGSSFSHLWGASAIGGVVHGLLGLTATAPGFAAFIVKPRLGSLAHATLRVPTLFGFINVSAAPGRLSLQLPCNTWATACLMVPLSGATGQAPDPEPTMRIDAAPVVSMREGLHLCAQQPIGCGAAGVARELDLLQHPATY